MGRKKKKKEAAPWRLDALSFVTYYSFARSLRQYITAGGPYNWAGRSMAGVLGSVPSYVSAWCILISFFGSMASVNTAGAFEVYAMHMMRNFGAAPGHPTARVSPFVPHAGLPTREIGCSPPPSYPSSDAVQPGLPRPGNQLLAELPGVAEHI